MVSKILMHSLLTGTMIIFVHSFGLPHGNGLIFVLAVYNTFLLRSRILLYESTCLLSIVAVAVEWDCIALSIRCDSNILGLFVEKREKANCVCTAACVELWVQYTHHMNRPNNANDTTCVSFIYDRQTMFKMFKESIHTMMGSKRSTCGCTMHTRTHMRTYHISSLLLVRSDFQE